MERQQPGGLGLGKQTALHIGVDHEDLLQRSRQETVQQQSADLPRPVQRGILGGVEKAVLNGDLVLVKVPAAILPHYIQLGVRVLGKSFSASLMTFWL